MRLGKREAVKDSRNMKLRAILQSTLPPLPIAFDVDDQYEGYLPTPVFANRIYGCCVIAARAHQTLRLELADQGGLITISDDEVTTEYFKESGGEDNGLYVLPSYRSWRNDGWKVGWTIYKIAAFAEITFKDHEAVKTGIYGAAGVGIGLSLPLTAQVQFESQTAWEVIGSKGTAAPNTWGGHYVYVVGYNSKGLVCITWGRRQFMTWDFLDYYADECYSVIDAKSPSYKGNIIDAAKVQNFLNNRK